MDKNKLHTVQGYRGISLLSIPGKCLETLVIGRLNYFLESTGQIPPQQYGFTAGRSTADVIKTVTDFVRRGCKLGTKCCLLALDIAVVGRAVLEPNLVWWQLPPLTCTDQSVLIGALFPFS